MDEGEEKEGRHKYDYSNLHQWIETADVAVANRVDAAQQIVKFDCARCRETWSCPRLTAEQCREVADLVRQKQMFGPLEFFRLAGFTFVSAKRTMHHIVSVPGKCHKCKRELPDDSEQQVVCRCRSLNLNW